MKCPLIDCRSADICTVSGANFLELPKWTKNNEGFHSSKWRSLFTDKYPSSKLLIRDCYVDVANYFREYGVCSQDGRENNTNDRVRDNGNWQVLLFPLFTVAPLSS